MQGVLQIKGHHWLTGGRLTKNQALLLDSAEVTLKTCYTRNPATRMPAEGPELPRSCCETLDQVHACRPDLTDQATESPEEEGFTDSSSVVINIYTILSYPSY